MTKLACARRQVYERAPQHVDLLLLDPDLATIYNAPLRVAAPYFASLGVAVPAAGCTEAFLLDLAALLAPGASSDVLSSQVCSGPCPLSR